MSSLPPPDFAGLLRRHRQAAHLTQEELAERAQLSVQAVGALERGVRKAPRKQTIDLLANALRLTEPAYVAFVEAAQASRAERGPQPVADPLLAPAAVSTEGPVLADGPTESLHAADERLLFVVGLLSRWRAASAARFRTRRMQVASVFGVLVLATSLLTAWHAVSSGHTLCLATDFPASDHYAASRALEDAVNLAVSQHARLDNGYALKVINYDDTSAVTHESDPEIGARNIQRIVNDPCVVGMVGPEYSTAAVAEMPIGARAGLAMISPSTTRSGLTLRAFAKLEGWDFDQLHPPGKPLSFFRIAPNDVVQGVVAAGYTFDDLGARTVYVVHDRERFGEDVVGGFAQGFQVKGGSILGIESISSANPADLAAVAARIVRAHPDAVYYAGLWDSGGALRAQLGADRFPGPFIGGEGIATDVGYVELAGSDANGSIAVAPNAVISGQTSAAAAAFLRSFGLRYPGRAVDLDTAEAYDAAMLLITGINHLVRAGQAVTRSSVLEQVRRVQYAGLIGPISFDGNGDIAHGVFTVYRVQRDVWTPIQEIRA